MQTIDSVIYTYGGFEVMVKILNLIAAIFQNKTFLNTTLTLATIVGTTMITFNLVQKKDVLDAVKWGMYSSLIMVTLISATSKVMVYDTVSERRQVVANVPNLISIVGGATSSVGHMTTKLFDTAFSTVGGPQYHKTGLAFTSYARSKLKGVEIVDPEFKRNMDEMIRQCVVYQVNIGTRYNYQDLIHADNLWEFLKSNASSIFHFHYVGKIKTTDDYGYETNQRLNKIVPCKEGMKYLDQQINDQVEQTMAAYSKDLLEFIGFKGASDRHPSSYSSRGKVNSYVKDKINLAFTSLNNLRSVSDAAQDIFKQQMTIASIRGMGGPTGFVNQRAAHKVKESYIATGNMAAVILPNLRLLMQALIYTSISFSLFLILLPNGYTILLNVLFGMFWIETWGPIYSVLNMIVSLSSDAQTQAMGSLTLKTVNRYVNTNELLAATASNMMMLVPYLGWVLTKGGVGSLVHLASSLTGSAANAAGGASEEMVSGNYSAGNLDFANARMHNVNSNQVQESSNFDSGAIVRSLQNGEVHTTTAGGNAVYRGGAGLSESTGNTSIAMSDALGYSLENRMSTEHSKLDALSKEYSEAESSTVNASADFISAYASNSQSDQSWNIDETTSEGRSFNKLIDIAQEQHEKITDEGYDATTYGAIGELKASIPLGKFAQFVFAAARKKPFDEAVSSLALDGNLSANRQIRNMLQDSYDETQSQVQKEGISLTTDDVYKLAKQQNFSDHNSEEFRATDNLMKSYETMEQKREAKSATEQQLESINQAYSDLKSGNLNVNQDESGNYYEFLAEKFNGDYHKAYTIAQRFPGQAKMYLNEFIEQKAQQLVENGLVA